MSSNHSPTTTASPETPPPAEEAKRAPHPVTAVLARAARTNTAWTFGVFLLLVVFFTVLRPHQFATTFNIRNVATDIATLLILGVGQTFVILTAGIDLSVGSVLVLSGVVAGKVMEAGGGTNAGWGAITLGCLAGIATGLAWGAVQGVLVAKAEVPPLVVTLGGYGAALGVAQIATGGADIRDVPTRFGDTIGAGRLGGVVPWLVVIAVVITVLAGLLLATTRFGRYTYAIGSNREAARRAGIRDQRHLIRIYALSGLTAGIAGVLALAWFTTTTISGHATDNLDAITGVVLGGTSLFGGIGSVAGTVIGVLIPAVLKNGVQIIGVQPFWQNVAVGVVLIAAVYLDQLRRRARRRG
jgi:ribose transport system permease protein